MLNMQDIYGSVTRAKCQWTKASMIPAFEEHLLGFNRCEGVTLALLAFNGLLHGLLIQYIICIHYVTAVSRQNHT